MPSLPPLQVGTIAYVHTVKFYEKGIDQQGPYYQVEYLIEEWAKSDDFVNLLLGIGTNGPHRYPLSTNLMCTEARCVAFGRVAISTRGLPDYRDGALIKAVYRSVGIAQGGATTNLALDDPFKQHQIDPNTPIVYCTQELDFSVEPIAIPCHQYQWAATGAVADNIAWQQDIHVTTLVLTFHRRQYLPASVIRAQRGRINTDAFLGAPAETVLFLGGKTKRDWSTDGSLQQVVVLTFKERDISWNKFPKPDGTWDYLQIGSDVNTRRYKKSDFTGLLNI
jgi:hypothetical protein